MWLFFYFVTQNKTSLSSIVLKFRTLSQVVTETSLTEKYKQTNIVTGKTIPPIYFVPGGGININLPRRLVANKKF